MSLSFDSDKFHLGKLCIHGHEYKQTGKSLRYKCRSCVECGRIKSQSEYTKAYKKAYIQSNPEIKEKSIQCLRDWNKSPKGLAKVQTEAYKAKAYQCTKRWRKNNPEKQIALGRVYTTTRRAKKKLVHQGLLDSKLINKRLEEFNGQCAYCGNKSESLDHFIPTSKGGCHTIGNILPACQSCNKSKAAKHVDVWYKSQSFFCTRRWRKILKVLGKTEATINQLPLF